MSVVVEAEMIKVPYVTNLFTVKVYVPVPGMISMDKLYFNGYTKTEAKNRARTELKKLGYKLKIVIVSE